MDMVERKILSTKYYGTTEYLKCVHCRYGRLKHDTAADTYELTTPHGLCYGPPPLREDYARESVRRKYVERCKASPHVTSHAVYMQLRDEVMQLAGPQLEPVIMPPYLQTLRIRAARKSIDNATFQFVSTP